MGVEEITVSENNVPRSAEPSRSGKDGVWLIILSMILGVLVSGFFPSLRKNLASMGKLFMALLQMCALPMLVISVISAPRRLFGEGSQSSMRPGLVILMKYIVSMALSATVGLAMAVLLRPGSRLGSHALDFIDRSFAGVDGGAAPAAVGDADIMVFFLRVVPENIFSALSIGNVASIMLFCLLAGTALARVGDSPRKVAFTLLDETESAISALLGWCLKLLPIGLFCLAGGQDYDWSSPLMSSLSGLIVTIVASLAVVAFIHAVLFIVCVQGGIWSGLRDLGRPALVAFGTQSSLASLPVVRAALEKQAALDQEQANFAAAIGITLNPAGGVVFYCVASVFLVQMYGVAVSPQVFCIIILGSMLAGMAAVTIPGLAALGMISIVAEPLILPSAPAVFLLTGIYPILDSALTAVNVIANTSLSALIGLRKREGD